MYEVENCVKTSENFRNKFRFTLEVKKILVANNGIAALKFIRSIRQWSYDRFSNERALKFVVMATPDDIDARAEYTQLADELIRVPSGPSQSNYGNVDLIIEIAQEVAVQAVWAGWGHASENPRLPEILEKCNILFLGPHCRAMRLLGDKISSSLIAQSLKIPVLPWSGGKTEIDLESNDHSVTISQTSYDECCIKNDQDLLTCANEIGYPVMVKAANGGGGKGIRKLESDNNCDRILKQISIEVPDSQIFVVKQLKSCRHIEIQIIGDLYGNVVSLFSRDCTIQRRHQKIIEEAPAIICPDHVLKSMEHHAVSLATSVNYYGAGTVEYLYDPSNEKYYFLELNPRLQVEHPCTEIIADINLPGCQLEVAIGSMLSEIKDIKKLFSFDSESKQPFQIITKPKAHVISVRITAESAEDGFRPSSGAIKQLNFRNSKNIWGYFSISSGGKLHQYADSQFGHLFSSGETREISRKGMILALKELSVHGEIRTTIDYLVNLLEHQSFLINRFYTDWLDHFNAHVSNNQPSLLTIICCASACIANNRMQSMIAEFKNGLERGKICKSEFLKKQIPIEFIYDSKQFNIFAVKASENGFFLMSKSSFKKVDIFPIGNEGSLILLDSKSYTCFLHEELSHYSVEIGSMHYLLRKRIEPGIIRSPSSGKLVSLLVEDGDLVQKGTDFAEIEVMKMVMPLTAPETGTIKILKHVGAALDSGSVIATIVLSTPSHINPPFITDDIFLFDETFNPLADVTISSQFDINRHEDCIERELRSNYKEAYENMNNILKGFCLPDPFFTNKLNNDFNTFIRYLTHPNFVSFQISSTLNYAKPYLPDHLYDLIGKLIEKYSINSTSVFNEFPSVEILSIINTHVQMILNKREKDKFISELSIFTDLINKLKNGPNYYKLTIFIDFIEKYLKVENIFDKSTFDNSINHLINNQEHIPDFSNHLIGIIVSHAHINYKNMLILKILNSLVNYTKYSHECNELIKKNLQILSNLMGVEYIKISLKAKQIMIQLLKPTFELRYNQLESIFLSIISNSNQKSLKILQEVVHSDGIIIDVLPSFFLSSNSLLRKISLEIYIRRTYMLYNIFRYNHISESTIPIISFQFSRKSNQNSLKNRQGLLTCLSSFDDLYQNFDTIVDKFNSYSDNSISSILHICICFQNNGCRQNEYSEICYKFLLTHLLTFFKCNIRRVTFLISYSQGELPYFFTYRSNVNFKEDMLHRNIEPATGYLLEISKMDNFNINSIPSENHNIYLFYGISKDNQTYVNDIRFFIRTIVRNPELISVEASFDYLVKVSELRLLEALDQLELVSSIVAYKPTSNHIFFNFTPCIVIDPNRTVECIQMIVFRYRKRLLKLNVIKAEMKMVVLIESGGQPIPLRLVVSTDTGYSLKIELYQEFYDHDLNKYVYKPFNHYYSGPLAGLPVDTPYECLSVFASKRLQARNLKTIYVYDIPTLFELIIKKDFEFRVKDLSSSRNDMNDSKCSFKELILDSDGNLIETDRESGVNDVGVVVWRARFVDKSFPIDLELIVIANDITIYNGSFATIESKIFKAACCFAKKNNFPLVYICCTSGARIGLATEVLDCFQVQWNDDTNIDKGVNYLYLNECDYNRLKETDSVVCRPIDVNGITRYQITSVVGATNGIGVENLTGSGMIAGEMSSCYDNIFTISYVSGKAVGIGAYLVRLGRRVIQMKASSILLTGAEALNKVLGSCIYSSHNQLGGIDIMYRNGVAQLVAHDDIEAIHMILKWISYYNCIVKPSLIIPNNYFDVDVDSRETDPRKMVYGYIGKENTFLHGFFDRQSTLEINNGWARTVIVGRARLNGIPCAYIMNDDKFIKTTTPVDPADPNDMTREYFSVGQVMTPDASFKFAQSIDDADRENLPLFIFSNFRGFSAGLRDMYNQVLKFGAMIVESLRKYKQPVFVYILPNGELRGGSWAVLDTQINPHSIEFYCSESGRANVLEPSGVVSIKKRSAMIRSAIERLNSDSNKNPGLSDNDLWENDRVIDDIFENFARLHDTPERMLKKGVIRKIVRWSDSRRFFSLRLKRRLLEFQLEAQLKSIDPNINFQLIINSVFNKSCPDHSYDDDIFVTDWLSQLLDENCINFLQSSSKPNYNGSSTGGTDLSLDVENIFGDSVDDLMQSSISYWISRLNID